MQHTCGCMCGCGSNMVVVQQHSHVCGQLHEDHFHPFWTCMGCESRCTSHAVICTRVKMVYTLSPNFDCYWTQGSLKPDVMQFPPSTRGINLCFSLYPLAASLSSLDSSPFWWLFLPVTSLLNGGGINSLYFFFAPTGSCPFQQHHCQIVGGFQASGMLLSGTKSPFSLQYSLHLLVLRMNLFETQVLLSSFCVVNVGCQRRLSSIILNFMVIDYKFIFFLCFIYFPRRHITSWGCTLLLAYQEIEAYCVY